MDRGADARPAGTALIAAEAVQGLGSMWRHWLVGKDGLSMPIRWAYMMPPGADLREENTLVRAEERT